MTQPEDTARWQSAVSNLAETAVAEHWDFLPTSGSRIGRHEYDGRLPDFSGNRIPNRVEQIHRTLGQLSSIPLLPEPNTMNRDSDYAMARLERNLLGNVPAAGIIQPRGDADATQ